MKTPRVEDFDPKARVKSVPDLGMGGMPQIEKPSLASPGQPQRNVVPRNQDTNQEIKKSRYIDFKKSRFQEVLNRLLASGNHERVGLDLPSDLWAMFDDTAYEFRRLTRGRRNRVTKTAVLVAALAYLLWDYEQRSTESLLYKFLIKKEE